MGESIGDELLHAALAVLPSDLAGLFGVLHRFTVARRAAARRLAERLAAEADPATLHAWLRECWDVLDGLAREANAVMHQTRPGAPLFPPGEGIRQCTLYMVRKKLHEHPPTAHHPVTQRLWERTKDGSAEYERLSFLYNLSLFACIPLAQGRLPGTAQLGHVLGAMVKPQPVPPCEVARGVEAIEAWLDELLRETYEALAQELRGEQERRDGPTR
jgi:hypothetical protein